MSEVCEQQVPQPSVSNHWDVELTHSFEGKVKKVGNITVTAKTREEAVKTALDVGGSIQSGMFNMWAEGKHMLTATKVEQC